ncbi:MAG: hypothetical protein JOZ13_01480 [Alphaproteobacteria bacterium]|nr:hypothetical protein [Alphaproteobacteria bacterium]
MARTPAAVAALIAGCGLAFGASADDARYEFKVQNASGSAATLTLDGKQVCALAAGATCTVSVPDGNPHAYGFSIAGGAAIAFQPGNPEMVDVCKLDAKAAHCVDPTGAATN